MKMFQGWNNCFISELKNSVRKINALGRKIKYQNNASALFFFYPKMGFNFFWYLWLPQRFTQISRPNRQYLRSPGHFMIGPKWPKNHQNHPKMGLRWDFWYLQSTWHDTDYSRWKKTVGWFLPVLGQIYPLKNALETCKMVCWAW